MCNKHRAAGHVRGIDNGPFLGAEDAERPGPLEQIVEAGHRLHHLDAVLLVLQALVDLDEGHDADVAQRLRGRLAVHRAVPRPFEKDRAQDLAAAEAWRGDDARAHLVYEAEHLLVAAPRTFLDAVALERLWG